MPTAAEFFCESPWHQDTMGTPYCVACGQRADGKTSLVGMDLATMVKLNMKSGAVLRHVDTGETITGNIEPTGPEFRIGPRGSRDLDRRAIPAEDGHNWIVGVPEVPTA